MPGASRMVCAGCGAPADLTYPFRCPRSGQGDIDHVLARVLEPDTIEFPRHDEPNPFIRYRRLFYSYHAACEHGMADADYVEIVDRLDEAIAHVDGHGFTVTPFAQCPADAGHSRGPLWIKNETGNVSGSHKARHLMGIMIHLRVLERLGMTNEPLPPLAIASCGNAALAAAVVARAADRVLRVFIPLDASSAVVHRLTDLGAEITVCRRQPGTAGDPCYLAFRAAVAAGALPFCCQGNENGLTIEGGATIGYEMIAQGPPLDRIVVQVGGGALASAIVHAFTEGVALGAAPRLPRVHTVQTRGAYPLKRACDRLVARVGATPEWIQSNFSSPEVQREVQYAATHRSEFMWPWEAEPHSIAHGILDDETYDWLAVVKGMLASGGSPIVVDEDALIEAYRVARETTGINVDHTGAAGYAGLRQLTADGEVRGGERVAVIFSGVQRGY